jgi:hypothetical protein
VPRIWFAGLEDARAAIDDLEPIIPDSFDDVALAYDLGQLTDDEYAALVTAVSGRAR